MHEQCDDFIKKLLQVDKKLKEAKADTDEARTELVCHPARTHTLHFPDIHIPA